jgi:hypothetical protein
MVKMCAVMERATTKATQMAAKAKKGSGKAGSGGGKTAAGLGFVRPFAFKVLCTDPLAANIIGTKGTTRAQLEEDTGCSVWISKRDEVYPSPPFRVLVLHGDEPDQVMRALDSIVANLVEVADREREPDSPLLGKEQGEYAFHLAVPTLMTGKLIGTKGANIRALRDQTGASISVDNEAFDGHKAARIAARPDSIRHALQLIHELVQAEAGSDNYTRWAATQPFSGVAEKGKGGGRRSRGRSREQQRHRGRSNGCGRSYTRSRSRSPRDGEHSHRPGGKKRRPEFSRIPDGAAIQAMDLFTRNFQDGNLDRNHAVSCTLPRQHVDALFEGGGDYVAYVERRTGTEVNIGEGCADGYSNLMITGPLLSVYLAHLAVMKTYHDKESQAKEGADRSSRVEELQQQLAVLEGQLHEATRSVTPGGSGGRGAIGRGGRR